MTRRPRRRRPQAKAKFLKDLERSRAAWEHAEGRVLCVDPAMGSTSVPGYALYVGGRLERSGVIQLDAGTSVKSRLEALRRYLKRFRAVDLLVVEQLRGKLVHAHLHWSTGVIVEGATGSPAVLEIPIPVWKAVSQRLEGYVKDDEQDAIAFGQACLWHLGLECDVLGLTKEAEDAKVVQGKAGRGRRADAGDGSGEDWFG